MRWAIAVIATVVLAATLARRAQASTSDTSSTWAGIDLANLNNVLASEPGEPFDQLPNLFEVAIVNATPSTYIPPSNAPRQQAANLRAFLDMIAFAEGTSGPDGYRTLFGGGLFESFADHPNQLITRKLAGRPITSTAAGRYQFLRRTWVVLKDRLSLPDFGPASQDAAAVELIRERGALNDVYAGRLTVAVDKVRKIWASLPGAGYAQPEKSLNALAGAYTQAGGTLET